MSAIFCISDFSNFSPDKKEIPDKKITQLTCDFEEINRTDNDKAGFYGKMFLRYPLH